MTLAKTTGAGALRSVSVLDEKVWRGNLGPGLKVDVLPKEGWNKTYALIGTRFGGIDLDFHSSLNGRRNRVPAGVAHFLEHKMFEKEAGDVMDAFTQLGASSNAMTGFHYTGYLVECTERFDACLDILVDFVMRPHFTPELVEKEKGIIAEEIKMYRDDASWRGFMGLLENLYGSHPVATDIAGTIESIGAIKAEHLELCHASFYRPENMYLVVAGKCDPDEVARQVTEVCARFPRLSEEVEVKRHPRAAGGRVKRKSRREAMPVQTPKVHLGWRIDRAALGLDSLDLEIGLEIALGYLLGRGGPLYGEAFRKGIADDSFGHEVYSEADYAFVIMAGDSKDPEGFRRHFREGLERELAAGIEKSELGIMQRKMVGDFVRSFDSISAVCWNAFECFAKDGDFFSYGDRVASFEVERALEIARAALAPSAMASHTLLPATA
jgi:predicted Zn-dependent peptidase